MVSYNNHLRLEIITDTDHEVKPFIVMDLLAKTIITPTKIILTFKCLLHNLKHVLHACSEKSYKQIYTSKCICITYMRKLEFFACAQTVTLSGHTGILVQVLLILL